MMPDTAYEPLSLGTTAGFVAVATMAYSILATGYARSTTKSVGRGPNKDHLSPVLLRKKLPQNLLGWRTHSEDDAQQDAHWESLRSVFADQGYVLWDKFDTYCFLKPGEGNDIAQNGAAYATPIRPMSSNAGGAGALYQFMMLNHSCHAASATDGRSVILRVLKVGEQGRQHLEILRFLARGPHSLLSTNHTLPLLQEIEVEDITFGVFPHVGGLVREAYGYWAENSVGDLIDMVLQMLSALEFIHKYRIVHRDAFRDNFLVQWQPDTLKSGTIAVQRPRVYLHDFESAVQFPKDCPVDKRVLVGTPCGSWESYGRQSPPEVLSGAPYNPFKVDVWQLGFSLSDMKTTIPELDALLVAMVEPEASKRMAVGVLCSKIKDVVHDMTPTSLAIPPIISESASESSPVR
ncbi:hypothetical protein C8Q80DRAFT_1134923 [Daedaleopsis nitida]|nr:hypothetical protein C8Q80DRAFT_1134923 [Daedaleopsis nitida]